MTEREREPAAYVSKKTLAQRLDCVESTVDELVKRGILPKPIHLSNGCVRWDWAECVRAINSLKPGALETVSDPYLSGAKNVA